MLTLKRNSRSRSWNGMISGRLRLDIHARIQRGGGQGSGHPPPPEKLQKYRIPSNIDLDSLKITKLPSQHSMLGHHRHASETPFNIPISTCKTWHRVFCQNNSLLASGQYCRRIQFGPRSERRGWSRSNLFDTLMLSRNIILIKVMLKNICRDETLLSMQRIPSKFLVNAWPKSASGGIRVKEKWTLLKPHITWSYQNSGNHFFHELW